MVVVLVISGVVGVVDVVRLIGMGVGAVLVGAVLVGAVLVSLGRLCHLDPCDHEAVRRERLCDDEPQIINRRWVEVDTHDEMG